MSMVQKSDRIKRSKASSRSVREVYDASVRQTLFTHLVAKGNDAVIILRQHRASYIGNQFKSFLISRNPACVRRICVSSQIISLC